MNLIFIITQIKILLSFIRYPYLYVFRHLFLTLKVPFVSNIQSIEPIEGLYVSYKALILPKNVYTLVLKNPINLKSYNSIYSFHLL